MKHLYVMLSLLIIMATQGCLCQKERKTLVLAGSTTIEPVVAKASDYLMKKRGIEIVVRSNGSHAGIDSLLQGDCDIAESSSPLSSEEKNRATEKGLTLQEYAIAHDYIVPVVNTKNPVQNLTLARLREIYSGRITRWSEFGWNEGGDILVVARDNNSGTGSVWNGIVLTNEPVLPGAVLKTSTSSVLGYVSENAGAIGYVSRGFINSDVRAIRVNGISSDDGKQYPVQRDLYLYTVKGRQNKEVRSFIVFLLSREGQEIIREAGFIPLPYRID